MFDNVFFKHELNSDIQCSYNDMNVADPDPGDPTLSGQPDLDPILNQLMLIL